MSSLLKNLNKLCLTGFAITILAVSTNLNILVKAENEETNTTYSSASSLVSSSSSLLSSKTASSAADSAESKKETEQISKETLSSNSSLESFSSEESNKTSNIPTKYSNLLNKFSSENEKIRLVVSLKSAPQENGIINAYNKSSINLKKDTVSKLQTNFLQSLSFQPQIISSFEFSPVVVILANKAEFTELSSHSNVEKIALDKLRRPSLATANQTTGVSVPNGAWDQGYTGAGKTIVVLDSGVDKNHPFLAGKVVEEMCYSAPTLADEFSFCPDEITPSFAPDSALPCPSEGCEHGTHVAGIAVGRDPGGVGYSGVARDANLIAGQIFVGIDNPAYCDFIGETNPCTGSYDTDALQALQRVLNVYQFNYDIAAVNMSIGGGEYFDEDSCNIDMETNYAPGYVQTLADLTNAGIAVTVASGNEGYTSSMGAPACLKNAISVGSTNKQGTALSSFSNTASFIDLLAPGGDFGGEECINSSVLNNAYSNICGTSMAAPYVAGSWALMQNYCTTTGKCNPDNVAEILSILQNTGVKVNDTRAGGSVTNMSVVNFTNNISLQKVVDDSASTNTSGTANKFNEGDKVIYNITLANTGPGTATNISLTDLVPSGLTYQGYTCTGCTYDAAIGTVLITTGSLPNLTPSSSVTLSIEATVNQGSYTQSPITNAINNLDFMLLDTDLTNNTATAQITINAAPLLKNLTVELQREQTSWTTNITNVLNNGSDPDGNLNLSTFTIVDAPDFGNLQVNLQTGEVQYMPFSLPLANPDKFVYQICDNEGACRTAEVIIQPFGYTAAMANLVTLVRTGGLFNPNNTSSSNLTTAILGFLITSLGVVILAWYSKTASTFKA